ncbi:MAG: DUF58 domain-containing protein, partial [Nocardiopsaceae bacterium]|nr:DUF58 domain-containing protein [Nocardiopsaceae bacterium]
MTLTGRAGLLALVGGLVIAIFGTGLAALIVNAVIVVLIIVDMLLAARIASLRVSRSGDAKIHLFQQGSTKLTVLNAGRRRLRGVVRDAWPPSATAMPSRAMITVDAGLSATVATTLPPQRRGAFEAGLGTIRARGPLGLAGRQR